jgi:hypothetical protein
MVMSERLRMGALVFPVSENTGLWCMVQAKFTRFTPSHNAAQLRRCDFPYFGHQLFGSTSLTRFTRTTTVHEQTTSGSKSLYDGHRDMRASQEMKRQTKRRKRQQREAATVSPAAAPPGKATLEQIRGEIEIRSKTQGGSKKTLDNLKVFFKR